MKGGVGARFSVSDEGSKVIPSIDRYSKSCAIDSPNKSARSDGVAANISCEGPGTVHDISSSEL